MPEPIKNEETENRIHSLCLFDVANITVLNRCAHCPGAARAALQHRRCPRDVSQPNIFQSVDPESSKTIESGSASSSKGKGKLHDEVDRLLSDQAAALSLGDSSTAPTLSLGDSPTAPSIQHPDAKRKANSEPHGQDKRKKKISVNVEYNHLSIEEYVQRKPPQPFRDLDFENPFVPGSRCVSDRTSFPGNLASDSFVPGFNMDTNLEGYGVIACKDGMVEMDWEWNSEV